MMELGPKDLRLMNWFGLKPLAARFLAARAINPIVQLLGRTLLPTRIAQRLPLAKREAFYKSRNVGSVTLLDPLRDIVARDIFWGSGQPTSRSEQHKFEFVELASKRSDYFLDVGAYAGVFALVAAKSNINLCAIAYEIVAENYELMCRNIAANGMAERICAQHLGIGKTSGTLRLPASMGLASNATSISLGSSFEDGAPVTITTLDEATKGLHGSFLLKIDVEGFEADVLEGGQSFLSRCRPEVILEVLPDAQEVCERIERLISPFNYQRYVFDDVGIMPMDRIEPGPVGKDWLITTRNLLSDDHAQTASP